MPDNIFFADELTAPDPERFKSMNVTRNPTGAMIQSPPTFREKTSLVREINKVDDIRGAQPKRLTAAVPRSTFFDTADVEGAQPKQHIFSRSGHYDVLSLENIEGARPRCTDLKTGRQVNPLDPIYKLPSATEVVAEPLKFKRDLFNIDDIPGTKTVTFTRPPRENFMKVDDIAGTRSRPLVRDAAGHFDQLDVQDINIGGVFVSKRQVNPLEPTYAVNGLVIKDEPARIVPVSRKARGEIMRSLHTADIEGAIPLTLDTTKVGSVPIGGRKDYIEINKTYDIDGAQSGTRRLGLRTNRITDPNEREYPLLDGRTLDADELAVGHTWYVATTKIEEVKARLAATNSLAGTNKPATVSMTPAAEYGRKLVDPRDMEMAALRGELAALRESRLRDAGGRRDSRSSLGISAPVSRKTSAASLPASSPLFSNEMTETKEDAFASKPGTPRTPLLSSGAHVVRVGGGKTVGASGDASEMKFSSNALARTFERKPDYESSLKGTIPRGETLQQRQMTRAMREDVAAVRSLP